MRRVAAPPEPDAPRVTVTLPAAWDDAAAGAIALMAGGSRPAALPALAEGWLAALAGCAGAELAARAHGLLLERRAAPDRAAWEGGGNVTELRLNLAAYAEGAGTVDTAALEETARLLAEWARCSGASTVSVTGLDGMLAGCGLDYGDAAARVLAAAVLRRVRACLGPRQRLVAGHPDPVDGLLGVETSGIAPALGPLGADGALSQASRARLAARGMSAEAALARVLCGETPLPAADPESHAAMIEAIGPCLDALARPVPLVGLVPPARAAMRRPLPRRRGGLAQRASIGGQKVFVVTGEFADGTPGEISISLPQAAPAARALGEALGQAISVGLQHGAPLADFLEALVGTRFGPGGTVEGDPAVAAATSPLDYIARTLAATYAPALRLPPADPEQDGPPPLLPLELPRDTAPRRRGLRVVK
jgi:hypothetical protein